MYIKPLVEIAAFQLNERLDKQQWPSDFLAKELEKLPANLKDCLRKLYLKHRRLPQDAAKVNVYLPKLLHEKVLELDLGEVQLMPDLSWLSKCSRLRMLSLQKSFSTHASESYNVHEVLKKLSHLEVLHLQYTGDTITDETIASMSLNCPRLRELDLGHCIAITDIGFENLRYSTIFTVIAYALVFLRQGRRNLVGGMGLSFWRY